MDTKFSLGMVVATPGILKNLLSEEINGALARHHSGDWGDVDDEDKQANETALTEGTRLFSAYHTKAGTKFWIITEWDRSLTTVLFPSEY